MNSDYLIANQETRNINFYNNVNCGKKWYNDSCSNIKNYANSQQAVYSPSDNKILYGHSTNLKAYGVSDGSCNQIDELVKEKHYKCGLGAAGGNRCVKQPIQPSPYSNSNSPSINEYFTSLENISPIHKFICFIILVLLIVLIINYSSRRITF